MDRTRAVAHIRARVAHAKALGVRARRRPLPRQRHPKAVALAYFQALRQILDHARRLVKERFLPRLAGWSAEFRRDSAADEVDATIASISHEVIASFSPERLKALALTYAQRAADFQAEQWKRQVRAAVGVDIFTPDPALHDRMATWASENAALIRRLPAQVLSEVEALTLRAVQAGTRAEDIEGEIDERFSVGESRAALIARDQIGKLTGQIDRARQEELGISRFVWRTAEDERVRPSHAELDGEVFEWKNPPTVDGETAIPGSPINCRCVAEPVLEDVIPED